MNLRATRREPTKLASLEAMASDQATNLEDTQPRSSMALDWTSDAENPRNWSLTRRAASTAVVSGIGFVRCVSLRYGSMCQPLVEVSLWLSHRRISMSGARHYLGKQYH
jgi:hypothetical protein